MATVAAQVTTTWTDSQQARDSIVNVCHFDGGTDYDSICNAVGHAFMGTPLSGGAGFQAYSGCESLEVRIYDLADPMPRPERAYQKFTGTSYAVSQPRLLAAVLSFYSGRNQPSLRGRNFIGPVPSTYVQGEQISQGGMEDMIQLAIGLSETDGGTWNHVVYSQKKAAPTPTITNYFVSSRWGVQHSRSLAQMSRLTYSPPS